MIPAGSSAFWGTTQGWLLPLVRAAAHLTITATQFPVTVVISDSLGNTLLHAALLATPRPVKGVVTSATMRLASNGPWHFQVLSGRINAVMTQADRPLLFAPLLADGRAILAALP